MPTKAASKATARAHALTRARPAPPRRQGFPAAASRDVRIIEPALQDRLARPTWSRTALPLRPVDARLARADCAASASSARRPGSPAGRSDLRAGARSAARRCVIGVLRSIRVRREPDHQHSRLPFRQSTRRSPQSAASVRSASMVASGCAVRVSVLPIATPMRRVPKSNASTVASGKWRPRVTRARRPRTAARNRCPATASPPAAAAPGEHRTARRRPPPR